MRALILAAGKGTRLAPLTNNRPKCLVELAGISLLDMQITVLKEAGVRDISIVTGYCANAIARPGYRMFFNKNFATTNMVESLFCAREIMRGDTDLILAYGDIVYELPVLEALISCNTPICLAVDRQWKRYWALRMTDPLLDAETLKLDENGMVCEIGKKPKDYNEIQGQYMGLIKVQADYVPRLKKVYDSMNQQDMYDGKNYRNMYMTSFIQYLIDLGWPVRAVPVDNGWLEIDTKADIDLYNRMHKEGTLKNYCEIVTDRSESGMNNRKR